MKIAHLDTGRDWRGGQGQVLLLLEGLRALRHESVLLAPRGPLLQRADAEGLAVERLRGWRPWRLDAAAAVTRALRGRGIDLLHAHTSHAHTLAVRAGGRLGLPVVVSRRVLAEVGRNPWSRAKYRTGVARFLCVSRPVLEALRRGGVPESRLLWVPSAVDVDRLEEVRMRVASGAAPSALATLAGAEPGAPVVGTAAALTAEKGAAAFVRMAREVGAARPDARFVWIGAGPERRTLERAARRAGLAARLRALGFRPDAHELVAQLAVFVSASEREGLGTAILEAQALGVPVVARDAGGVRDAIEDGVNGRLVPERELGEAVRATLADPDAALRRAAVARDTVRGFSPRAMVERTLAAYEAVLREGSRLTRP